MKIKSAEFEFSAPFLRDCPKWALPEVALIGRSNVGKSSLLNALTGRRDLAKVSSTPGKTQLINFFRVNGSWSLVDLPGYGYAEVNKVKRMGFNEAVAEFIMGRPNLRRLLVLIDSRLEPQEIDLEFIRWLDEQRVPFGLVFTKIDKQSASQTRANLEVFQRALAGRRGGVPEILSSSSKTGAGQSEILAYIEKALKEQRRSDG